MSLSGSLADFDISYIFQIISQESKTGKLILTERNTKCVAIFKNGKIISAGINEHDIKTMLLQYLRYELNAPLKYILQLDNRLKSDFRSLANELLFSKKISTTELKSIAETGLEDLTCELFLWSSGLYKFELLENVDNFQIMDIAISSDTITMEAARRVDEWQAISQVVKPQSVFISATDLPDNLDSVSPFDNISDYILKFIDGSSSVDFICKQVFLPNYKIYEAIYTLAVADKIIQLPEKLSTPINAALKRNTKIKTETLTTTYLTTLV